MGTERKKGERALTRRQVMQIRKRYAPGGLGRSNTLARIAKDYGVSVGTVWAAVNGIRGYEDEKLSKPRGRPPESLRKRRQLEEILEQVEQGVRYPVEEEPDPDEEG